eukprot:UN06808
MVCNIPSKFIFHIIFILFHFFFRGWPWWLYIFNAILFNDTLIQVFQIIFMSFHKFVNFLQVFGIIFRVNFRQSFSDKFPVAPIFPHR